LTLGKTTLESDTCLFRLHDGKLQLEKLEFLLRPSRGDFEVQAVVQLVGNGQCSFKDCILTFDQARDTHLALATLADPGKTMKSETSLRSAEQGPLLSLENCFVRGEGDLIWGRISRPFALTATNILAALTGSLLHVEIQAEAAAAQPGAQMEAHLSHITTYLGGPLVHFHAGKDLKGLVQLQCEAKECLFLPAVADGPFVRLDGPETDDKMLAKLIWKGDHNAYGAFKDMVAFQPNEQEMTLPISLEKWKTLFGETMSKFSVKPAGVPNPNALLSQTLPEQFKPGEDLQGFGAEFKK
jgi:hypothetical protein